ncbi:MAG: SDR family oxidoreductase [Desulfobacterales bacterium]
MNLGLEGKPVLVMAASDGLGKAAALTFAREGARVMLFARSEDRLRQAREDIAAATGHEAEIFPGDITIAADVHNAVATTARRFGSVFGLVNNSGGPPAGGFDAFDDQAWQKAFELTLLGFIRSIRAVLPLMRAAGGGRIVNFTSSSTRQAIDNLILSNTFRMGVVGLTKTLARELGRDNILINVVGPGKMETARLRSIEAVRAEKLGLSLADLQQKSAAEIPLGRYGRPEELARLAVFLCSAANTYITGQTVLADGGLVQAY